MNKLNQIKKQFKKEKMWSEYKKRFAHKQMRLLFSNVAILMKDDINLKMLFDMETQLMRVEISPEMFVETFKSLEDKVEFKCDWEIFGKFIWYIYQTSTYWKDIKVGKSNIFTHENYLEVNQLKRDFYQKWIDSIDKELKDFNLFVIKVSRMVF